MRHRIKSGKIGSFNPERVEVPEELQEEQALSSEWRRLLVIEGTGEVCEMTYNGSTGGGGFDNFDQD